MFISCDPFQAGPGSPNDPTLYLTFDDGPGDTVGMLDSGPGPRTYNVAKYLSDCGIFATFFVVGRHVEDKTGDSTGVSLVQQVRGMGHTIGNHTYSHERLTELASWDQGSPAREVIRTSSLIEAAIPGAQDSILFRSPGGDWSRGIAQAMRGDLLACLKFVGPINWDIDAADYQKWTLPPDQAAKQIFDLITTPEPKSGILLMHDSSAADPYLMSTNQTYQILTTLIPCLSKVPYKFKRLDEIPAIQTAMNTPLFLSLKATKGGNYWISVDNGAVGLIERSDPGASETLEGIAVGSGRIALKSGGMYLSVDQQDGVIRLSSSLDQTGMFEIVDLGGSTYAFATFNTASRQNMLRYLAADNGFVIDANGSTDLPSETRFTFVNGSYDTAC